MRRKIYKILDAAVPGCLIENIDGRGRVGVFLSRDDGCAYSPAEVSLLIDGQVNSLRVSSISSDARVVRTKAR